MIHLYPLGQYFAGLVTGAIFSWIMTWIHYENKSHQEEDDLSYSSEDNTSVNTIIIPNIPGKSLFIFQCPDDIVADIKKISETLSFHTPKSSKISEDTEKILTDLKKLKEQCSTLGQGDQVSRDIRMAIELATSTLSLAKNVEYLLSDDSESPQPQESTELDDTAFLQKATPIDDRKLFESAKIIDPMPLARNSSKYKTMAKLENTEQVEGILSIRDEMEIILRYRGIVGERYHFAMDKLKQEGYNLHPLYVSIGAKMPLPAYSGTTIGVRIRDPDFDHERQQPSSEAKIIEIIDVGGIDARDVGLIRL